MDIIRQLTPVSSGSNPPSPVSTASGSNSPLDPDDQGTNGVVAAWESFLQRIFADDVYDRIHATQRSSGCPLVNSAMQHVIVQSQSLGHYNSLNDLFQHYGIRIQQESRLRAVVYWILRVLPFTNTAADDPLKTLKALATTYLQENPDGGIGYSFGTLLARYITHRTVVQYQLQDSQAHLIGGNAPFYIPGVSRLEEVHVNRDGNQDDVGVNLHLVRGSPVASSGPGSLLGRVEMELEEFLKERRADTVYLCHGTDVVSASNIVLRGPNLQFGRQCADFGSAFYMTNSWQYALLAAHQAKKGSSIDTECAVLVFPVRKSVLEEYKLLDLRQDLDRWTQVTKYGIRGERMESHDMEDEYTTADCIVGPTVKNFEQVPYPQEPRQSNYTQWAFRNSRVTRRVLEAVVENGDLHFFRFVDGDWDSTTGERGEGDERGSGRGSDSGSGRGGRWNRGGRRNRRGSRN